MSSEALRKGAQEPSREGAAAGAAAAGARRELPVWVFELGLLLAAVIWGGAFVVLKDTLDAMTPIWIIAVRFCLATLVMIAILGKGKYNIIIALGILFIPSFARIVRSEVAKQKNTDYVRNARLMGASNMRILFLHIMPNIVPVLLSSVAIGFNNAVLSEASMSYLGVGVQPPDPSLGRLLSEAQGYLFQAPWYAICTGLAIILLILGFGLLSEGMGGE